MEKEDKIYRLKWLKQKRDDLEIKGHLISLTQAKEIAALTNELYASVEDE